MQSKSGAVFTSGRANPAGNNLSSFLGFNLIDDFIHFARANLIALIEKAAGALVVFGIAESPLSLPTGFGDRTGKQASWGSLPFSL